MNINCHTHTPRFSDDFIWEKIKDDPFWHDKNNGVINPASGVYYNIQSHFPILYDDVQKEKIKSGHPLIEEYKDFCSKNRIQILGYFFGDVWNKENILNKQNCTLEGNYFSKKLNENYLWIQDPILSISKDYNVVPILAIPVKVALFLQLPACHHHFLS